MQKVSSWNGKKVRAAFKAKKWPHDQESNKNRRAEENRNEDKP